MKDLVLFRVGIFLIILSAIGFLFGLFSAKGSYRNLRFEFPLSIINSIAVDDEGRIYCGLGFYSRVQVYNQNGKFLMSWHVDAYEGGFDIKIDEKDYLLVETYRGKRRYHFSLNGTLMKTEVLEEIGHERIREVTDPFGNFYSIKCSFLGPSIVKKTKGSTELIIRTPWYLWFLQFPFPLIFFAILGGIFCWYYLFLAPIPKR